MSDIALAAILTATILVASSISAEIGLSVALVELALGVLVGNAFSLSVPDWLSAARPSLRPGTEPEPEVGV